LVTAVFDGSPAHEADLRVSDLVVAIDGKEVIDPNAFGYRFATKMIGERAEFTVLRSGREETVSISLQPAPETIPRDTRELLEFSPFEGATVMNLSPAVAQELGLDGLPEGVIIAEVRTRWSGRSCWPASGRYRPRDQQPVDRQHAHAGDHHEDTTAYLAS
jgi:hypothetical protein